MRVPDILSDSKKKFEELYLRSKRKYWIYSTISFILSFSTVSISAAISLSSTYSTPTSVISLLGALIAILKSSEEIFKISRQRHESKRLIMRSKLILDDVTSKIIEYQDYFKNGNNSIIPEEYNHQSLYDFVRKHYDEVDQIMIGDTSID